MIWLHYKEWPKDDEYIGEKSKKETENLFKEITDENFQNLWKELDFGIEQANRTLNYINTKRSLKNSLCKLSKTNDKEKIIMAPRKKYCNLQRKP